jgi:sugar-specific transcriptional regulator TrmB
MINKQILLNLGLSNNESEVYYILLELKESLASEIAKRTEISRPHVYDSLNKLLQKGLINYVIKNGNRYFKLANPNKLLDYLKEQGTEIKEKEKEIKNVLPELTSLYSQIKERPIIETYEGGEGIKTILNDIINTKKEMLAFNTLGKELIKYIPEHYLKRYLKERQRHKIRSRQFYVEGADVYRHPMVKYKKLPKSFQPVALFVYGNNVVMFILIDLPTSIRIQSKDVAKLYKEQFELMWKNTK